MSGGDSDWLGLRQTPARVGQVRRQGLAIRLCLLVASAAAGGHAREPDRGAPSTLPATPTAPASQPSPEAVNADPELVYPDPGDFRHDGFYLRVSAGLGYVRASFEFDGTRSLASSPDVSGAILVGGTVADHFVLGGGALGTDISPSEEQDYDEPEPEPIPDDADVGVIGAFVDIYYDPSLGFHLGALVGRATVNVSGNSQASNSQLFDTRGLGLYLFTGYDLWLGEQWSASFAFNYLRADTEGSSNGIRGETTVNAFEFKLGILLH